MDKPTLTLLPTRPITQVVPTMPAVNALLWTLHRRLATVPTRIAQPAFGLLQASK